LRLEGRRKLHVLIGVAASWRVHRVPNELMGGFGQDPVQRHVLAFLVIRILPLPGKEEVEEGTRADTGNTQAREEMELAAGALVVKLQYLDVKGAKDFEPTFRAAINARANAGLMNVSGPISVSNRNEIAELAAKYRLPMIYTLRDFVEVGGLVSYGVSFPGLHHRAATYVDKILKGAKPADLPVEQPTKFEFIINLKAAKQIGLTIPPNILARADRVIK
jgi:hypothetical protein